MAVTFNPNGTCTITVDSQVLGVANADGVKIAFRTYNDDIYTDNRGPRIPEEVHMNGGEAFISVELPKYDDAVLQLLLAKKEGGTIGQMNTIGGLRVAASKTSEVLLASPIDNKAYTFKSAWVIDDASVNLNTQIKVWSLVFRAIPNASNILYTRA